MTLCNCKPGCTVGALIISAIIGVLTAFLQITGIITATITFAWVVFGISVGYLGILLATAAVNPQRQRCENYCTVLRVVLLGLLGGILLAVILLAVGIVATSVVSAILVGLLLFFFALSLSGTACLVRCLASCEG